MKAELSIQLTRVKHNHANTYNMRIGNRVIKYDDWRDFVNAVRDEADYFASESFHPDAVFDSQWLSQRDRQ
jgi:hypothetical protein